MWKMLQNKKTQDYLIGSGKVHSLKEFVDEVFSKLKLDKKNLITNVNILKRKYRYKRI